MLPEAVVNASVNSSRAQPPPPPPGYCGAFARPQSRGWSICKFCPARGPGICQPRAFDTHAVSYQNLTTHRPDTGFYLKSKQIGSFQGREKLKRFVKACSRFYACISSLLIKPELYSETRELST